MMVHIQFHGRQDGLKRVPSADEFPAKMTGRLEYDGYTLTLWVPANQNGAWLAEAMILMMDLPIYGWENGLQVRHLPNMNDVLVKGNPIVNEGRCGAKLTNELAKKYPTVNLKGKEW